MTRLSIQLTVRNRTTIRLSDRSPRHVTGRCRP